MVRGVVAGAVAAAVWVAAEPLGQRVFRTPYSDVRLLGALLTARAPWRGVGIAAHLANGALFGATFSRIGGGGWRQGLVAAELENLVLWPAMALVDRIHPDRRRGSWPPLVSNPRVFAYEATMHALFGVVLGLLHPAARDRNRLDAPLSDLTRRCLSSVETNSQPGEPWQRQPEQPDDHDVERPREVADRSAGDACPSR